MRIKVVKQVATVCDRHSVLLTIDDKQKFVRYASPFLNFLLATALWPYLEQKMQILGCCYSL